jgi:glycerol-3-phosphate cytidylyltransferase-like family protein
MNLSDLLEDGNKDLVIIYPGRFHPFHIGHGKVYKYLKQKYSNAQVFISTSGKVDGDRSPFTFEEKRKMMILAGVSSSDIVQTKSPYQSIEIMERFDKDKTVVVFAVSEKDMAEDPRFDFSNGLKLKKNGEPAYLQKWNSLDDAETFGTRGYIATTPTFKFKVLGQEINSASQIRNMIAKSDDTKLTQMLQDLYSVTDVPQDIIDLFKNKVGNKETMNENWDENSFSKFLKENVIEDNIMKTGILKTITEGKSPHKKGTKKYNAHMAAMHAESIDEEFDRKVKEVVESKMSVAADIKDYVDDHKEHFDSYPMEVEVDDKVYDFDEYWAILDKVYPDAYDNQYTNESWVAIAEKELGREITNEEKAELSEFWPAVAAVAARIPPQTYATAGTAIGAAASKAGKWIKSKLKSSVNHKLKREGVTEDYANEQHEQLEYIHHVLQECGDGNMDITMVEQAIEYVEDIREQHFDADGSTKSESVTEAGVLAHGGKGQYKAVSSGGVVRIMYKGKEIASGDFDSGADGWFVSREGDKGQKFFGNAQDMVDHFADKKITEWIQEPREGQKWTGQERNFIQELCLRMDGVSKSPEGLKWMGKSKTWDEGNILSNDTDLQKVMSWAEQNKDDLYDRMGSEFKVYSDGNDGGDSGRGQSDGNQIMQNINAKIGSVDEGVMGTIGQGIDNAVVGAGKLIKKGAKAVAPHLKKAAVDGAKKMSKLGSKNTSTSFDGKGGSTTSVAYNEDDSSDLEKMQNSYKHNEDRNNHSENILMLAQAFGSRPEIKAVEGLLTIIRRQGYTTPDQSEMMYNAIHKKYYGQLFPAENEGNEFSGELAKAKIDGKKEFKVDGKTYKVKEALIKLIDNQKMK